MTRNFSIGIGIMTSLVVLFILTILDSILYNSAFWTHFLGRFFRYMFDIYSDTEFLFTIILAIISLGFMSIDYMGNIKLFIINRLIQNHTKLTKVLWIGLLLNFIILSFYFIVFIFACIFGLGSSCGDWWSLGFIIGFIFLVGTLLLLLIIYIIIKLLTTR